MSSSFYGISIHYFLALVPPGMVYLATVVLLWGKSGLETYIGDFEWGPAIGLGLSLALGFLITPIAYFLEVNVYRKFIVKLPEDDPYDGISETIVEAHALGVTTDFVYTTWGWMICHFNVSVGVLIIWLVYLIGFFFAHGTCIATVGATSVALKSGLLLVFAMANGWAAWFLDKQRDQTFRRFRTAVAQAKLQAQPLLAADDLERIAGIGPEIASVLRAGGIMTFHELAEADLDELERILEEAGVRLAGPETWPDQANLAAEGKWVELEAMQEKLKGGRKA